MGLWVEPGWLLLAADGDPEDECAHIRVVEVVAHLASALVLAHAQQLLCDAGHQTQVWLQVRILPQPPDDFLREGALLIKVIQPQVQLVCPHSNPTHASWGEGGGGEDC